MDKSKVNITVRKQTYTIISDRPAEVIIALANDLNASLDEIMSSGKISLTQGLLLAALGYADEAKEQSAQATKLKDEIGAYLADAESAMTERDRLKRENERLKEKLKAAQRGVSGSSEQ